MSGNSIKILRCISKIMAPILVGTYPELHQNELAHQHSKTKNHAESAMVLGAHMRKLVGAAELVTTQLGSRSFLIL